MGTGRDTTASTPPSQHPSINFIGIAPLPSPNFGSHPVVTTPSRDRTGAKSSTGQHCSSSAVSGRDGEGQPFTGGSESHLTPLPRRLFSHLGCCHGSRSPSQSQIHCCCHRIELGGCCSPPRCGRASPGMAPPLSGTTLPVPALSDIPVLGPEQPW